MILCQLVQSIHALEQGNACSADDVEAVLLWREPRRSSKVFLGGMYILICLRQLVLGILSLIIFERVSKNSGHHGAGSLPSLLCQLHPLASLGPHKPIQVEN